MKRIEFRRLLRSTLAPLVPPEELHDHEALIVEYLLGCQLPDLLLRPEMPVPDGAVPRLESVAKRLARHEPVQYILGYAYFYGRRFRVTPRTLIPRRETEELCQLVLQTYAATPPLHGLDLGTGTGCIAITLSLENPRLRMHAGDLSPAAIDVARRNAQDHALDLELSVLDLYTFAPPSASYDFIVSNPPYIPMRERQRMPSRVLDYEPHAALFVPDGAPLAPYQAIARLAATALRPGGHVFLELHEDLAEQARAYYLQEGFRGVRVGYDAQGKARFLVAHLG